MIRCHQPLCLVLEAHVERRQSYRLAALPPMLLHTRREVKERLLPRAADWVGLLLHLTESIEMELQLCDRSAQAGMPCA